MSVERNVKFCKYSDLADEDDIVTLKEYIIKRISEITSDAFFSWTCIYMLNCVVVLLLGLFTLMDAEESNLAV